MKTDKQKIIVFGEASKKTLHKGYWDTLQFANLLRYLQSIGLPIASSCDGAGICEKCVVNNLLLSCQIDGEWLRNNKMNDTLMIKISYL